MRDVWKGMILGALAGAIVGLALEAFKQAGDGVKRTAEEASSRAPMVKDAMVDFADRAAHKLQDADMAHHAAEAVKRAGEQAKSAAESARGKLSDASS